MQAPSNPSPQSYRAVQRNPRLGTALYMQGKKQTALAIQRYHILCAALQKKYAVCDIVPIIGRRSIGGSPELISRVTINFTAYTEFKLHPMKEVELPDGEAGMPFNITDLYTYKMAIGADWNMREGGILYAIGEYGNFFNTMSHYHSNPRNDSLMEESWNPLFEKLQNSEYRKNLIPCMFFGQKNGCLDQNCPFLHDRETVLAYRAQLLEDRRARIMDTKYSPTGRQSVTRYHSFLNCVAGSDEALRAQIAGAVDLDVGKDRAYCANPRCMKPWKKGEKTKPLKACQRCKFTMYCSPECQKTDWPRHKKDPCAPIDDIIGNDDLWNPIGHRKGTQSLRNMNDAKTRTFWHPDA